MFFQLLFLDHFHGRANLVQSKRCAAGGDDDFRQFCCLRHTVGYMAYRANDGGRPSGEEGKTRCGRKKEC